MDNMKDSRTDFHPKNIKVKMTECRRSVCRGGCLCACIYARTCVHMHVVHFHSSLKDWRGGGGGGGGGQSKLH